MEFEWDPAKNEANRGKHGLSFDEVSELFTSRRDYLEIYDGTHAAEEDRFIAIGVIRRGAVVVVFTERGDEVIRIIGARLATRAEARLLGRYLIGKR